MKTGGRSKAGLAAMLATALTVGAVGCSRTSSEPTAPSVPSAAVAPPMANVTPDPTQVIEKAVDTDARLRRQRARKRFKEEQ
jgi:hypothetical protein